MSALETKFKMEQVTESRSNESLYSPVLNFVISGESGGPGGVAVGVLTGQVLNSQVRLATSSQDSNGWCVPVILFTFLISSPFLPFFPLSFLLKMIVTVFIP